jgi:hypothetical protein
MADSKNGSPGTIYTWFDEKTTYLIDVTVYILSDKDIVNNSS